jgi:hypothetical protein
MKKESSIVQILIKNVKEETYLINRVANLSSDDDMYCAEVFQEIAELPKGKYNLEIKTFTED